MAHVTDYDVWHESEEPVTVDAVIANLQANVEIAKQVIRTTVRKLASAPEMESHSALATAIISRRSRTDVPADTWQKLEIFIDKYFS
jgi:5'-methylthioadenosine phosphorylase